MNEAPCSRHDAASVLIDLPGCRVLDEVDTVDGGRRVRIAAMTLEAGCPPCGVLPARVHQRTSSG